VRRNGLPGDELAVDEVGRWRMDPDASTLLRDGGHEAPLRLHGMFTYLADAARFEECLTGRSYPVAQEHDYPALEVEYLTLAKFAPGAPVRRPDCPAALYDRQQMLLDTLAAVRTWAIQGQVLELFDASGLSLAALEAVYLR
jgi:hypothetical protein